MRRLLTLASQELSICEQRVCCKTTCTRALHFTSLQRNYASPFLSLLEDNEEINSSSTKTSSSMSSSSRLQTRVNNLPFCNNTLEKKIESEKYSTETSNDVIDNNVQSVVDEFVTRPLLQNKTINTAKPSSDCNNNIGSNDKTNANTEKNNGCSSDKDTDKLFASTRYGKHEVPTVSYKTFLQTNTTDQYKVFISDRFGMPAELPRGTPQSFEELAELCPNHLKDELQTLLSIRKWSTLTSVQRAVIPFILEYRDVLCVSPTATGKTFAYVFPTMLRLALDAAQGQNGQACNSPLNHVTNHMNSSNEESANNNANLNGKDVEALIQDKINRGEICRYCELNLRSSRLCPMTGVPHPPPPPLSSSSNNKEGIEQLQFANLRKPMWLHELNTVAAPRVLVLTPTSPLVHQTFRLFMALRGEYNIRYLLRAKTAEEQELYLRALRNPDVLISTPETILTPLLKRKLTLRQVKTVILDEVDLLVSSNHFEAIKMILSNLPKASNRAQRLCFAASLPVKAYEAIRDNMLLTSHRFILADANVRQDVLYQQPQLTLTQQQEKEEGKTNLPSQPQLTSSTSPSSTENALIPSSTAMVRHLQTSASQLTHVVYMLGRAEKISKLVWMFKSGLLTPNQRVLIFCNSRHNVAYVYERLRSEVRQVHFTTLTSMAGQQARVGVLKMFTTGVSTCLICTDMLSRGVDLSEVIYVVHYDTPTEMDTWIHRCGRCGRNGLPGYCYTFFQPENIRLAKPLVAHLRHNGQVVPPKLAEYAKQSFEDLFTRSLFHSPTRPRRLNDPQNSTPVLGMNSPRFPDYRQSKLQKYIRPLEALLQQYY